MAAALPLYGSIAADCDLHADEQAFWQDVRNIETESGYLNSVDFYYREAFGVFVGMKPTEEAQHGRATPRT